jgi:hypothetical protein
VDEAGGKSTIDDVDRTEHGAGSAGRWLTMGSMMWLTCMGSARREACLKGRRRLSTWRGYILPALCPGIMGGAIQRGGLARRHDAWETLTSAERVHGKHCLTLRSHRHHRAQ